jgi:hypothetical protein
VRRSPKAAARGQTHPSNNKKKKKKVRSRKARDALFFCSCKARDSLSFCKESLTLQERTLALHQKNPGINGMCPASRMFIVSFFERVQHHLRLAVFKERCCTAQPRKQRVARPK